ncbi:uncharacterized protein LOC129231606 [Uloborus diversus]|uniref:uncharacterized protein LOC129231606 n=1 Tax=Uloborus diversus TaxID=327109 RepID=UPI002409D62F|nr:uncharacterized protein LOC129231606 [Uloborus diversus]
MKSLVILCLVIASCTALPAKPAQTSVLDLLEDLEGKIQDNGEVLIAKLVTLVHHVENAVLHVKEVVPKVYEKIHQEADEVLAGLKKVSDEIQELLGRKNAMFGFDLLGGLTELTGGTKLSTVLDLLSLADKAHRVVNDAKEFVPHLQTTMDKLQKRLEDHVTDFATHVVKELGLQDVVAHSMTNKIEELAQKVQEKAHELILHLLHSMEETLDILESKLPEEFKRVEKAVAEIREKIHELIVQIEQTLVMRSFSLLDLAGNVSEGTSLSTAFKVMSLVDKFNTCVQDVKNFEPRAEEFMQHSVKKVADRAQEFFTHVADQLLKM